MASARDQQIRALYRAALERPPAERASFVAEVSGGDAQLKASIELLLSRGGATDAGTRITTPSEAAVELLAGTSLGHYRIDGVLGRGGMGVVYRATDAKLHRPVAIKFLSSAVADAEARRRFKQEAETTSGLNHPHIVTVYDVGEHDGQQYIVSELVDGGTLDDWSTATPKRSWRQSVELVTGIADALAAAHAAGVLHRDVKPGNILIGNNGYAKLADFGLAKLVGIGAQDPLSHEASRNTRAGVVVGTIAYMSPEQAAGQSLDARSDVFSFGIVLYELIAGRRPFEAANELEVLKAIAHATPAPLPADVPELLRMAVDKALEKEPADRYQTIRELVVDLRRVVQRRGMAIEVAPRARPAAWPIAALGAGLTGAVTATIVLATLYFGQAPPAAQPIRFRVPAPGLNTRAAMPLSISPDGRRIAYIAFAANSAPRLHVRSLDSFDAQPLAGTDDAAALFWSPDSRTIAFLADGELKKISADGGPVQLLGDAGSALSGSWGRDGVILLSSSDAANGAAIGALGRMAAEGGPVRPVTTVDAARDEILPYAPQFLPDGRQFLYAGEGPDRSNSLLATLYLGSLDGAAPKRIMTLDSVANARPRVVYASGYLLFARDTTLFAQPFDLDAAALAGEPVPVASPVRRFAASENGVLVYDDRDPATSDGAVSELRWFGRDGTALGTLGPPGTYRGPAISPDGRRVAVDLVEGGNRDIWTIDVARGVPVRLTFDPAIDVGATWSRDGTQIMFGTTRGTPGARTYDIYRRAASGAGTDELVLSAGVDETIVPNDWTDTEFVFSRSSVARYVNSADLWRLPSAGQRAPEPVLASPSHEGAAQISPDGRWMAYRTNESGIYQIVVQPFPDTAQGKWQVSTRGAVEAKWRADGRELFFLGSDGAMMAVDVTPGDTFVFGEPRVLFQTPLTVPSVPLILVFDVTPDGERFLVNVPQGEAAATAAADAAASVLNVVVNWTAPLTGSR